MTWNYRILASEYRGEFYFKIHEVYYDDQGNPESHSVEGTKIEGDTITEIKNILHNMAESLKKPILLVDGFPSEYSK